MKFFIATVIFLILILGTSQAQKSLEKKPIKALWEFLKSGDLKGHTRTFYMMTINEGDLTDYHALGTGLGIRYETPSFKGFQFAIGGSTIFNLLSTPLDISDSITNKYSRYEAGLFDVSQKSKKADLNKLEELYLKYSFRKSSIILGRQLLKTPFLNPQDGRIRPSFEEGVWLNINEIKNLKIKLGFLWRMAPRSTIEWYDVAKSMGLYPVGKNLDGTKSGYKGNLKSAGILLLGLQYQKQDLSIQVWNQMLENIFNTVFVQADFKPALDSNKTTRLILGVQGIAQQPIAFGGNPDASKTYFNPKHLTWIIGGRIGARIKNLAFTFNYSYIARTGRFLMPREWGVEPLYTFMSRERTEGTGNVHSFSANCSYIFKKISLKTVLKYGYYMRPDVMNFELNKYTLPSYGHAQIVLDKTFKKFMKGLHFKLIYLYKHALGNTYNNPKFVFNKVNMHHLSFVVNYTF